MSGTCDPAIAGDNCYLADTGSASFMASSTPAGGVDGACPEPSNLVFTRDDG